MMIGSHLGERYELTMLVLESPIFSAYMARDKVLGRDVWVRILKPPFSAEPRFLEKVQEIVKRIGSVESGGIERMLDLQQEEGVVYLVTEPSKGSALAERIRKLAPYSVPVSVAMAVSTLEALRSLHEAGFVHGDVGAHNIVVQPDGTARLQLPGLWEAYSSSETAGGVMLPAMAPYLAPEVSSGGMPTASSDVYGLGVILFQLLTGKFPYSAETPVAMAMRHASVPTPSPKVINPAVPTALDELVRKAMSKDPSLRYANAGAMLADLRRIEETVRFGKPAPNVQKAQPLKEAPTAAAAPKVEKRVAEEEREERPRKEKLPKAPREPGDVPVWLLVSFTFVLAVAVALIGVWWFFTMNAPKVVKVPNVMGKPKEDAEALLHRLGLQMRVAGRESSEKVPIGNVLDVNPAANQQVREGGIVSVKLSAGSRLVMVPDLRGRSPEQARDALGKLNLELDRVVEEQNSKIQRGLIVRQDPDARKRVERFSRINVWISAGNQAPVVSPGDAKTRYLYTMRIRLTRITESVMLKVEITDANGTRKIYEDEHYPNQEVTVRTDGYGKTAVFRIYYNGEMVSQVTKNADEPSPDAGNGGDGNTEENTDEGDNE